MRFAIPRSQGGFSLIEMTVVVVVVALISVAAVSLLPLGTQTIKNEHSSNALERANQSLLGFMQTHLRLPFADKDGDGKADSGTTAGWLPYQDLGMDAPLRLAYQAHPALLVAPGDEFSPYFGDPTPTSPPVINGLDLCRHLLNTARASTPISGLGMTGAYVVSQPANASPLGIDTLARQQPLPGTTSSDFTVSYAAGVGELASQLSCSDRLGRAQGAAQSAYAAAAVADLAEFNYHFRKFDVLTSEAMLSAAKTGLAAAGTSLAFGLFDQSIAIFLTLSGWPPSPLGGVVGAGELTVATASIAYSIQQIHASEQDVIGAEETLEAAKAARDRAQSQFQAATSVRDKAEMEARRIDGLGIAQ